MKISNSSRTLVMAFAGVAVLSLAACSSAPTRKDCEKADAYKIGYAAGENGKADNFGELNNYCTGQGLPLAVDKHDYGRKVGLAKYCDESRGSKDAEKGVNNSICQTEAVPPYQAAYQKRLTELRASKEKELAKLEQEKAKVQQKQEKVQGDLNQIQGSTEANPAQ